MIARKNGLILYVVYNALTMIFWKINVSFIYFDNNKSKGEYLAKYSAPTPPYGCCCSILGGGSIEEIRVVFSHLICMYFVRTVLEKGLLI